MNYIELINRFWILHEEYSFRPAEISLYFYLLKVNNSCGWKPRFRHRNLKIESALDISFAVLKQARTHLAEAGLIEYVSTQGVSDVVYKLTGGRSDDTPEAGAKESSEGRGEDTSANKINKTKQKKNFVDPPLVSQVRRPNDQPFDVGDFVTHVRQHTKYSDEFLRALKLPPSKTETLWSLLDDFAAERIARGEPSGTERELRAHFINWAKIQLRNQSNKYEQNIIYR